MIRLFQTPLCPDCIEAIAVLKEKNISYEDVDITASILNLKEFMEIRDTHAEFNRLKGTGQIGVPAFLKDDGSIVFDICQL